MDKVKKKIIYFEIGSILCTGLLTVIGLGVWPCQQLGILKNNINSITIRGNITIWILFGIGAILTTKVFHIERKNACTEEKQKKCRNIFSKEDMRKQYQESLNKCTEVIILVRHLEDLCEDEKQKVRIKELGENCTILYATSENSKIERELLKSKVKLISFSSSGDISNIKGQIVKGPQPQCILTEKQDKEEFHLINIENIYIQSAIMNNIDRLISDKNQESKFKN